MYDKFSEEDEINAQKRINIADNKKYFDTWILLQDWVDTNKENRLNLDDFVSISWGGNCVFVNIRHGKFPGTCFVVDATQIRPEFKQDLELAKRKMLVYKKIGKI